LGLGARSVRGPWSVLGPSSVRRRLFFVLGIVLGLVSFACAGNAVRERKADAALDDLNTTARVKTALLNDQQLDATRIGVSTVNGVVTLSGTVRTPAEAARAIEVTRATTGVKDVKSMLRTSDQGRTTDPGPRTTKDPGSRTDQAPGPKS
jgi:Flp pilus assembly secretin CpaC